MTDDELISQFENCTIPNDSFRHADHVRTAFLYVSRYPAIEALERFSASLRCFAAAHGKPDRYNETITWAYLFLIRERIARTGGTLSWLEFAQANPDLLNWRDSILGNYYRADTLTSELAKRVFLFPDKL
jgi:hypothetical protein